MQYSCDPQVELTGQTVQSFFANLQYEVIKPFLASNGLTEVDQSGWYPVQDVLAIMNDLGKASDATSNFVAIGLSEADLSPLTPEMARIPFESFLVMYTELYQTRHRGGDAGCMRVDQIEPHHVAMICAVPYPDGVMYGLMYGFARRLLPRGSGFTVYYQAGMLRRDEGGTETIIHIEWD